MSRQKSILVTGCAGFIGSNFTKQFHRQFLKIQIIGLDDLSTGRKSEINSLAKFYKGSITDKKLLEKIFKIHELEFVFNFAALPRVSYSIEEPIKTTNVNITGVVSLLDISQKYKVKKFIHSSSSSVYGGAKKLPTKESENSPDPKSPYATQKYADEIFCKVFSDIFNINTICLRYFNVFGPGQYGDSPYSTVISAWLEAAYFPGKKKAFIEGDGKQSRDFCYIDNVIKANILAMKSKKKFAGEVFNVAHGERTSVNKVRNLIEKYTSRRLILEQRPPRVGDVKHTHADISKAKKLLGYKPKVKFEEGLKKTVAWFEMRIK